MKKGNLLFPLLVMAMGWGSCSKNDPANAGNGSLCVRLDIDPSVTIATTAATKSADAASFTLEILQNETTVKKLSPLGDEPVPVELAAGSYMVRAYSQTFTAPAFDTPVYGGTAAASIAVDNQTVVSICCKQTNAGARVVYSDAFKQKHTVFSTTLRQVQGALTYTSADVSGGRIGYFLPDRATIVVTADGVEYEQELEMEPETLYNISIDDAPAAVSGSMGFNITVSTQVAEKDVPVVFPSGVVDYTETVGSVSVTSEKGIAKFTDWSCPKMTYGGSNVFISSETPSDYNGASGGNYVLFKVSGSGFTVSGLNTSMAATDMVLTFGCCSFSQNYVIDNLAVSVSQDGGNSFIPLTIAPDARLLNRKWAQISIREGIPKAKNLVFRFDCAGTNYAIDDIRLKTL